MNDERWHILRNLTAPERKQYRAVGGSIPRDVPPAVGEWWKLGDPLTVRARQRPYKHRRRPVPKRARARRVAA